MTSDNIRAGDVVVRVAGDNVVMRVGALARVEWAGWGTNIDTGEPGLSLVLREYPDPGDGADSWCGANFRRIDPAERCFTKAMRGLLPLETTVA